MTDRLTPPQLRDLADLIWSPDISPPKPPDNFYLVCTCLMEISEGLRNSAARREAEASNPCKDPGACEVGGCLSPSACQAAAGEREGPGSAAAPTEPVICTVCLMPAKWGDECRSFPCPYPKRPVEDKPTPAADELVTRLRSLTKNGADYGYLWNACEQAADALDAKDAEIADLVGGLMDCVHALESEGGIHPIFIANGNAILAKHKAVSNAP